MTVDVTQLVRDYVAFLNAAGLRFQHRETTLFCEAIEAMDTIAPTATPSPTPAETPAVSSADAAPPTAAPEG